MRIREKDGQVINADLDELEDVARELGLDLGVKPGEARHGAVGIRAIQDAPWKLRSEDKSDDTLGVLEGRFAVFNTWTEIDSFWEGRFMEQLAPGAFTKTFKENRAGMRCLFQHGRDPQIGMKPLGPILDVRQDDAGAPYEVGLLDTSYNRDLMPGLQTGQYGASFRFQVIREEVNAEPGTSDHNPDGIEERTITECRVREFGPVTWGAYEDATAGMRSLNAEFFEESERWALLLTHLRARREVPARPRTPAPAKVPEAAADVPEVTVVPAAAAPSEKSTKGHLSAARTLRTSRKDPIWKL